MSTIEPPTSMSPILAREPEHQKESGVSVRVLRSFAEVEEIRLSWESWPGNPDADIDFYLTVVRSTSDIVRPHVVVVYREGKPDAILVGRIDRRRFESRLGYFRFGQQANVLYLVNGALKGNSSFENIELLVREVCSSLARNEADVAYLNLHAETSDFYKIARTMPGLLCRDRFCVAQPHFIATVPNSVEEFYRRFSSKTRSVLKSKRVKLEKAFSGEINIRCFQTADEVDSAVEEIEEVAQKSYLRGLGLGFIDSPEMRERLKLKAQKGWLRTYVLYGGQRPLAYWNGDLVQDTFGGNYVGYDREFSNYSPGMYIMTKVIESFCNGDKDVVRRIDFGHGDAEYKASLGMCESLEAPIHIFAPSLKGIGMNLLRMSTTGMELAIKAILVKTNLLQKIKKYWRTRATKNAG